MTMKNNEESEFLKEDIYEYAELEKIIDSGSISFINLMKVCTDFILNKILTKDNMQKLNIDNESEMKAIHYILQVKAYFSEKIKTKETLTGERLSCWRVHNGLGYKNAQRDLLRLIVCFLFNEETNAKETEYAQDNKYSIIFNCLYELGSGYCKQLGLYLQKIWIRDCKCFATFNHTKPLSGFVFV